MTVQKKLLNIPIKEHVRSSRFPRNSVEYEEVVASFSIEKYRNYDFNENDFSSMPYKEYAHRSTDHICPQIH